MYLSVYLDKNSLRTADFIVFRVSDESLFFDSYSQGEEKRRLGCTVISSEGEKKREKALTVRKRGRLKESDYSTLLWKYTICGAFTIVVWHLINMSKNILVTISSFSPWGICPQAWNVPINYRHSLLSSTGCEDTKRGHWKTCLADLERVIKHNVQGGFMCKSKVMTGHAYVELASISE